MGVIAVITAGTADIPVAEEAAVIAELLGNPVDRIYDVGVAGIHRLLMINWIEFERPMWSLSLPEWKPPWPVWLGDLLAARSLGFLPMWDMVQVLKGLRHFFPC